MARFVTRHGSVLLLRQAFRQVADDRVAGPELLLHVGELASCVLQEQGAAGQVKQRKQIQEHDAKGTADDRPVFSKDDVLVRREEAQLNDDALLANCRSQDVEGYSRIP